MGLTPVQRAYLTDRDEGLSDWDQYEVWNLRHFGSSIFDGGGEYKARELWNQHRGVYLTEFIRTNPGKRPWAWWQWDAPRWDGWGRGTYWEEKFPEPRRRLGGTGTPAWETQGVVPSFKYGLPTAWAIDPNDPPIYESQASYLERLGLLTAAELLWLAEHPEAREPETINLNQED